MKRAIIIAKGRVQRVGYRDLVAEIANGLNIGGIAKDLPDGTVRIVAEAEEEILEQFIALIEARDDPMIKVTNVNVKFEHATGEFEYFDIEYEDFQQEGFERIGVAAVYLKRIDKRLINVDKKQGSMLEKQDVMIEKQDSMLEKQDVMIEKQDETISIIKSGVEEMREFRTETQQNFTTLDTKYGEVAENMERILEEMKEERKESRESMDRILNAILKLVEDKNK